MKKWDIVWVYDAELGKKFNGIEKKGKRPIVIYSTNEIWMGRYLYLEMSTHKQIGDIYDASVKVAEWIDKNTGEKKESWVLTNRIGLISKKNIILKKSNANVKNDKHKLISEKITKYFCNDIIQENIFLKNVIKDLQEQLLKK
jgi:hypothetical protein